MKRIIILAMVLVMLLISIGGCWPWRDEGGRDARDRGHERDGGYDRGGGHGDSRDAEGPRGPGGSGPGGSGGGH